VTLDQIIGFIGFAVSIASFVGSLLQWISEGRLKVTRTVVFAFVFVCGVLMSMFLIKPPSIDRFNVEPRAVKTGEIATLHWEVSGSPKRIKLRRKIDTLETEEVVGPMGDQPIQVNSAISWLIVAEAWIGPSVTMPASIGTLETLIDKFQFEPESVTIGDEVKLTWVTNATKVRVVTDNAEGSGLPTKALPRKGSMNIVPTKVGFFHSRLEVVGPGGIVISDASLNVLPLKSASLEAALSPTEVESNDPIKVSWTAADSSQVFIKDTDEHGRVNSLGPFAPSASPQIINLSSYGRHSVEVLAQGPGGDNSKVLSVNIVERLKPILRIIGLSLSESSSVRDSLAIGSLVSQQLEAFFKRRVADKYDIVLEGPTGSVRGNDNASLGRSRKRDKIAYAAVYEIDVVKKPGLFRSSWTVETTANVTIRLEEEFTHALVQTGKGTATLKMNTMVDRAGRAILPKDLEKSVVEAAVIKAIADFSKAEIGHSY
jgi:hypothetical protein